MDAKHVKVAGAGRPRPQSQAGSDTDSRRRTQTPSMAIPRPLVRRHSTNSSSVNKGKSLSLYSGDDQTKHREMPMYRGRHHDDVKRSDEGKRSEDAKRTSDLRRIDDVKLRESVSRKQTTPAATKISCEPNIKPILKTGKDVPVSKFSNASIRETMTTAPSAKTAPIGTDGKCCYRLPNNPEMKLRKSVSFRDDSFSRSSKRSSSPSHFVHTGNLSDSRNTQIFV
ncbi:hypothetical protein ACF0H5_002893 [Mactra antiquata]